MKTTFSKFRIHSLVLAATVFMTGCSEQVEPTDVISREQVEAMASAQEGLLNGIVSYMVTYNSWGGSAKPLNDWGYPCQMFFREVLGADIPVVSSSYSYWYSIEAGTETRYTPYYTYRFYYNLIRTTNDLIGIINPETATQQSRQYLGAGLAFRALAYMDIARMYEFRPTGVASLDQKATSNGIWGLTIPIVTPDLTLNQLRNNPRVDYATMYRFILTDLDNAEKYIDGYSPSSKTLPDVSAVHGLKARFWLEVATRMEDETDAEHIIEMDKKTSDYHKLGVTTAADCYTLSQKYARLAMAAHSPMSQDQWQDSKTGFNTPNDSWMWSMSVSTKEQLGYMYCSFPGTVCTEPEWGMARGYKACRMIGSSLYNSIPDGDWRKTSWISHDDLDSLSYALYMEYGIKTEHSKICENKDFSAPKILEVDKSISADKEAEERRKKVDGFLAAKIKKYQSLLSATDLCSLYPYSNLKFRPGSGNLDDWEIGCLVDLPLMRVEEMYLIDAECTAHLQGAGAGINALKSFVNTYRYTDGSYTAGNASTMDEFNTQLVLQKRIEFWGEGISYFDIKRLKQQVRRKDNTNYEDAFRFNSKEGYVAPWMNYYILDYEINQNPAVKPNPDTSGSITVTNE